MQERGEKRSGSDSDAHSGRKKSRLHEDHKDENAPLYDAEPVADFTRDLNAHDRTGEDHGENQTLLPGALSANEIKSMHTVLADLTDDELKNITILPAGTRLEQGAKYIDLRHLSRASSSPDPIWWRMLSTHTFQRKRRITCSGIASIR